MTTLETLKAARELITDQAKWCQGGLAKDKNGIFVDDMDESAVSFCAIGAVPRTESMSDVFDALDEAAGQELGVFNDSHSHSEVLAVFDKAIAKFEATA